MTKEAQAKDPSTSPEVLDKLAKDNDGYTRWCVAQNTNAPAEALAKLAEDKCLREAAIENPNCPAAVHLWLKMGGFAGMTLAEFVEKVNNENGQK